jgi:hypothetical protein
MRKKTTILRVSKGIFQNMAPENCSNYDKNDVPSFGADRSSISQSALSSKVIDDKETPLEICYDVLLTQLSAWH